ncbi:MAG: substrate-binding domain-containing protein [Lachnospiraceae bacterium]|nr:substrate-binding domain-containing protein [Lachnospiraceae bacterium]
MNKKMMRVILSTTMSAAMCIGMVSTVSAADGGKIKIGLTDANMSNESNAIFSNAAIEYAKTMDNVELIVNDGEGDANKQIAQCESFVAQGCDVVIISPYDFDGAVTAAQVCVDAGVPVFVAKGIIADMDLVQTYVGSNDVDAGEMEMEYIADKLDGKGNIVIIEGPTGVTGAVLRNDGIQNVLEEYPDINVLYSQPADWYRDKAMELMENWLQLGADIDAVVAHNDEMALGAYDALEAAGKGDIPVIGIDGIQAAVKSVGEGKMSASILQDSKSIAEKALDVAVQIANGEEIEDTYDIPYQVITQDNYEDFLTE